MYKKLIQIDLDGVLNNYLGNYDKNKINDIKDGAFEFLEKLAENYSLELFTVRDKKLCEEWLVKNKLNQFFQGVTNIKNPFSSIFIDDRAINFGGDFEETYNKIVKFKPYWKK